MGQQGETPTGTENDSAELPGDDGSFDDGFENHSTPTATPEPVAAESKPEEPKAPTVEERIAAAEALIGTLRSTQEKSFGTAFGKIGGIERTLTSAGVDIDQEDIDAMRADGFESHAKALEKIRDLKVVRAGVAFTDDDRTEIRTTLKREMQVEQVADEHPDWKEVSETAEFQAWKATRSAADRHKLDNTWAPGFIIKALTEFKTAKASKPQPQANSSSNRRDIVGAAVTPRGSGGNPAAASKDDEFDAGFKQR